MLPADGGRRQGGVHPPMSLMNLLAPPEPPRRRLARRRAVPPLAAGALVAGLTLAVLAGWALGWRGLTAFVPGWPMMKFHNALAMLAAALALLLAGVERGRARGGARTGWRQAGLLLAAWPFLYGALTLAEHASGWNSGLNDVVFQDALTAHSFVPGRPAPATVLGLMLAGVALWTWRRPRALALFTGCAGLLLTLAWLALTGLLYGVQEKAGTLFFGTVALPTALGFFVLGGGLFALRPAEGLGRLFTSPHRAGQLARRLVPMAVGLTVGLGALRLWAQSRWHFSTELGVALYGTGMLVSLVVIALRGAWLVDRLDLRRRRAEEEKVRDFAAREEALRQLEEAEARLAASERRFRGIFNSTFQFLGLLTPKGTVLEANQTALDLIGARAEDVLGRPFAETPWWAHSAAEQAKLGDAILRAARGETVRFETSHPSADGQVRHVDFNIKPVRDAHGRVVQLVPEGRDITARKLDEARLRESEERFRGAFENSAIGMALVGLDGRWLRVNPALCALVGRTEAELLACTFQDITHPEDLDADLAQLRALLAGEVTHYQMEKRYFHRDGHIVRILLAVTLVRDAAGAPVHFVSQIEDITVRHEAERQMRASLEEKEVLLREIHHRVKNNLQVITSLLQLQSGYVHDPRDAAIFAECQARIHAMGLVHDRLYRSGNLATIDFSEHLRELAALIARGQADEAGRIRLSIESEPAEVNLDTAIPLGLIAAELITNAYKHAFRDRPGGCIAVRLGHDAARRLTLSVEDDGAGLPAGFAPEQARTLGLRLIRALAGQLRAEFSIGPGAGGAKMRLVIPA